MNIIQKNTYEHIISRKIISGAIHLLNIITCTTLRLTFGESFNLVELCVIIELLTNLVVDYANNPCWLPDKIKTLIPDPLLI